MQSLENAVNFSDTFRRQFKLANQQIDSVTVQNGEQRNDTCIATTKYGERHVRDRMRIS